MPGARLTALLLLTTSLAAADNLKPLISSYYIYWDQSKVNPAVEKYGASLDIICAFGLSFHSDGHLTPAFDSLPNTLAYLRSVAPQSKIFLTAVNDIIGGGKSKLKDAGIVQDVLSDPAKTNIHIQELLKFADGFDGIEIDYESLNPATRDAFSGFIDQLTAEAHKQKKMVSVVVEPKANDFRYKGAGAIDWAAVAQSADTVKIMAYYQHFPGGTPGPVAPPTWVEEVTRFALTQIPKEKLAVALVTNGVDWSDRDKGKTIDYDTAMNIARGKREKIKIDRASQSPTFRYKDDSSHLVWFEDKNSLDAKITVLKKAGVPHIALWRLGSGDETFWKSIK